MAPPTAYSPMPVPGYEPFVPLAPLPSARGPFIDDQTVILNPEEELFRRQSDTGDAAG